MEQAALAESPACGRGDSSQLCNTWHRLLRSAQHGTNMEDDRLPGTQLSIVHFVGVQRCVNGSEPASKPASMLLAVSEYVEIDQGAGPLQRTRGTASENPSETEANIVVHRKMAYSAEGITAMLVADRFQHFNALDFTHHSPHHETCRQPDQMQLDLNSTSSLEPSTIPGSSKL
eukprot:1590048-Rhodomonas_salina.2